MKYSDALELAESFTKKYPFLILSGSVALILEGELHEREVGDIDFVVNSKDLSSEIFDEEIEDIMDCEEYMDTDEESCDLVSNYKSDCGTYNILVYRDSTPIFCQKENCIDMRIQIPQQIWHYKKKMKRKKDNLDLL